MRPTHVSTNPAGIDDHASNAAWGGIDRQATYNHIHRGLRAAIGECAARGVIGNRPHTASNGHDQLALALRYIFDECLCDSHRAQGVDVEHTGPCFVIDVSDALTARAADPGIVDEDINGSALEFRSGRLDTREVSHIQGDDVQFVVTRVS